MLDLRGGTLARFDDGDIGGRSLRFVSMASPHVMGLRAEGPEGPSPTRQPAPAASGVPSASRG